MKVKWQVNDGFLNNGVHTSEVDIEDIYRSVGDESGAVKWELEEIIDEDFRQKISFEILDMDEVVAAVQEYAKEMKDD